MFLIILIQSILLINVSCYISPFKSRVCSPLLSSRRNINHNFKSLENEPHIVFLEYILYTRALEYRDKYTFSDSHSFSEILNNINKYILYPLNEDEFYKVDDYKEEIYEEVEDEEEIDEEAGFNEFSMEKMCKKPRI